MRKIPKRRARYRGGRMDALEAVTLLELAERLTDFAGGMVAVEAPGIRVGFAADEEYGAVKMKVITPSTAPDIYVSIDDEWDFTAWLVMDGHAYPFPTIEGALRAWRGVDPKMASDDGFANARDCELWDRMPEPLGGAS